MITIRRKPDEVLLELGGGAYPLVHPRCRGGRDVAIDIRPCMDSQGLSTVDFTCSFEEPLPLADREFDGVVSHFALEHVSWRKIPQLLSEIFRVLKPGGKLVLVVPNTRAQLEWIMDHPEGWDGHHFFESASCLLFGDQDYSDNCHRAYLDPEMITQLLREAGFQEVTTQPYGERATDMVAEAVRPVSSEETGSADQKQVEEMSRGPLPRSDAITTKLSDVTDDRSDVAERVGTTDRSASTERVVPSDGSVPKERQEGAQAPSSLFANLPREQLFDKVYFNGGGKVGGYAREGFRDFPVHEVTAKHILARHPRSVLEVGAARGYILKRIQDVGILAWGLEISRHCLLTRACDKLILQDICLPPWPMSSESFDLCYSIATLEHIPEKFLPSVISEMSRVSKRGLHGIDFGHRDDGFDKTHFCLKPKEFWQDAFGRYAPGYPVEILDKEELERGNFPQDVLRGDGRVKVAVGTFTCMAHRGWQNLDMHDLAQFAGANGYNFQRVDVRQGLPYKTGTVSLIHSSHFLEHLTYEEGVRFLRECRRVIDPQKGAMRIVVPDAGKLIEMFQRAIPPNPRGVTVRNDPATHPLTLDDFAEINDGVAKAKTSVAKLHALLWEGHASVYDQDTLVESLLDSGFVPYPTTFRKIGTDHSGLTQILHETQDSFPDLSLFMDAVPAVG